MLDAESGNQERTLTELIWNSETLERTVTISFVGSVPCGRRSDLECGGSTPLSGRCGSTHRSDSLSRFEPHSREPASWGQVAPPRSLAAPKLFLSALGASVIQSHLSERARAR